MKLILKGKVFYIVIFVLIIYTLLFLKFLIDINKQYELKNEDFCNSWGGICNVDHLELKDTCPIDNNNDEWIECCQWDKEITPQIPEQYWNEMTEIQRIKAASMKWNQEDWDSEINAYND